jgi:hypothetical protein
MGMYAASAGRSGGEYYTPQEVSELLARITVVGKTEVNKVYDPACGLPPLSRSHRSASRSGVLPNALGQDRDQIVRQVDGALALVLRPTDDHGDPPAASTSAWPARCRQAWPAGAGMIMIRPRAVSRDSTTQRQVNPGTVRRAMVDPAQHEAVVSAASSRCKATDLRTKSLPRAASRCVRGSRGTRTRAGLRWPR